jgi:Ca2+-transporting ATPase
VLRALARQVQVFSRVSPAHKLQIVRALQQAGRVVGMSGDGINDGPALKAADIGIAMGQSGTDVARDVADVVLENDDLELLVRAVSHGRTTYSNIRKSLRFLLSTNFSEVMVTFIAVAAGLGHPLTTLQLLWINLISDVFPSLALALEAPETSVMKLPPRDPKEPVLGKADFMRMTRESAVITGGALLASGYGWTRYGWGLRTSTIGFQGLVLGQLLHALCCRSDRRSVFTSRRLPPNPYLAFSLAGSLGVQLLTLTFPPLRGLLGLTGLGLADGLVIGGTALASLAINEASKRPLEARLS